MTIDKNPITVRAMIFLNKQNFFQGFLFSKKAVCGSVVNNNCCYSRNVLEHFTHNER